MFENEIKPYDKSTNLQNYAEFCKSFTWDDANREFSWHTTGKVNIAHEAIDRHAADPDRAHLNCIIYSYGERRENITYEQMRRLSNRFGNVLRGLGVGKGDHVFLLLPQVPERYVAMVGCAKTGAVFAPLYLDYREGAVKERMLDGQGKILITSSDYLDRAPAEELPDLEHIIIVGAEASDPDAGEVAWDQAMEAASDELEIEWVDREDPLMLTYTSGHGGKPVGLLHPHDAMRGYLMTARWVLDLKDGDVLWTHSRPGWLLNTVYSAFAPWLCGIESFVTEGMNTAEEVYQHMEENSITVFYTIPTIYRLIIAAGEQLTKQFNLSRIRHLLSVLEPLNPEVIYAVMRMLLVPIYDTWWSAETGMITIASFRCLSIKPGYLGKACPGIQSAIVDNQGKEVPPFQMGELAIKTGWPCMTRGIWGNEKLYQRYLRNKPWFMSSDTAFVDHDNYYFYQGRADDVIISSAGRVGISEIENLLLLHPAVAESAVIRVTLKDKTKKIKAFITLESSYRPSELIKRKIMTYVKNNLSADTAPSDIEFCETLPMDSQGRILRRVLKAWELGLPVGNLTGG